MHGPDCAPCLRCENSDLIGVVEFDPRDLCRRCAKAVREEIVDDPCGLCGPEDEVGCVTRDPDGLVACEGCRREMTPEVA